MLKVVHDEQHALLAHVIEQLLLIAFGSLIFR
jgi:hypothetical protein